VGLLTPRVQFELAPRDPPDIVVRAPALVVLGQARQNTERLLMQRFTLQREPLLERRAVSKDELIEERTAIECRRVFEPLRTARTGCWLPVWMRRQSAVR